MQLPNTLLSGSGAPACGIAVQFQYPYQFALPYTSLNMQKIMLNAGVQMTGENYAMFRENESLLLSSRAKRGPSVLPIGGNLETFAFGRRSAFSAAIYALQSATASAAEVIKARLLRETTPPPSSNSPSLSPCSWF